MNIGILTSGGDAPGMNAAIRAAVRTCIKRGITPYGIWHGFNGLIDGEIRQMDVSSVADILHRGGTMLRTARSERFMTEEGQLRALDMMKNFGLDGIIVIGGDGSMRGSYELSQRGAKMMLVPGTIDNDLPYTDFTIGFDTAVNTVLSAISNIRDTSSSHEKTTVIEVMGRHSGDIALYSGLAGGAECILVPEKPLDLNAMYRVIVEGHNRGKLHNIIIKAEGVDIGTAELAEEITKHTGLETRIVVLGFLQRGGSPTATDRLLASRAAAKAVELLADGSDSKAIGVAGGEIFAMPLEEAVNATRDFNDKFLELAEVLS